MYNPLDSFWFWLQFWGYGFVVVFGIAVLRLVVPEEPPKEAEEDVRFWVRIQEFQINNRPWYYVIPIWGVTGLAGVAGCQAFIGEVPIVSWQQAAFVWCVGVSYIGGYFFTRYGSGAPLAPSLVQKVNYGIIIGLTATVAVMFGLGYRLSLKRTNDLREQQVRVDRSKVTADTTTPPALKRQMDTLAVKLTKIDSTLAEQAKQDSISNAKVNAILHNTTPTGKHK